MHCGDRKARAMLSRASPGQQAFWAFCRVNSLTAQMLSRVPSPDPGKALWGLGVGRQSSNPFAQPNRPLPISSRGALARSCPR
jgi:hypothetical protein